MKKKNGKKEREQKYEVLQKKEGKMMAATDRTERERKKERKKKWIERETERDKKNTVASISCCKP